MIEDIIKKMEAGLTNLPDDKQAELKSLLTKLKDEVDALAGENAQDAESIAGFTRVAAHEVTRDNREEALVDASLAGLSASARKFEVTHPDLVGTVNGICHIMAKMGL